MDMLRDISDGIMRLTINRPAKANTLTIELRDIFTAAIAEAGRDEAVTGVILRAAPCRVFSGGVDLSNREELPLPQLSARRASIVFEMAMALLDCAKPVVAEVNGAAIGGGCITALLADRIVCSPAASFSLPEIRLGIPSFLAADLVTIRLGGAMARSMVLFGDPQGAAALAGCGGALLVDDASDLPARAQAEALRLAALPAAAFGELKAWMRAPLRHQLLAAIEKTIERNALEKSHAESAAAIRQVLR